MGTLPVNMWGRNQCTALGIHRQPPICVMTRLYIALPQQENSVKLANFLKCLSLYNNDEIRSHA